MDGKEERFGSFTSFMDPRGFQLSGKDQVQNELRGFISYDVGLHLKKD